MMRALRRCPSGLAIQCRSEAGGATLELERNGGLLTKLITKADHDG